MENSQIDLERLINLKDNSDCLAICFNKQEDTIFFATNGKYIYKTDLLGKNMSLLTTINEVDRGWDDEHDNTFLQDFTFANDGYIYAAARNCIIRVDPHSGDYDSVIGDKFSGPWVPTVSLQIKTLICILEIMILGYYFLIRLIIGI